MKKIVLIALSLFFCVTAFSQTIIYVTPAGAGNKAGTSWGNAAPAANLQTKIDSAANNTQIWLKAGSYAPGAYPASCTKCGSDVRNYAFVLKAGVSLYGGFLGTEGSLSQRNIATNITTLTGDLSGVGYSGYKSYHVLLALNGNETIDGLTISDGYANFSDNKANIINGVLINNSCGGGLYAYKSNLVINNVTFTNNTVTATSNVTANYSGSVLQTTGDIPPAAKGGGLYNEGGNLSLSNVVFSNNTAKGADGVENGVSSAYGGAMYNAGGSIVLANVKLSHNIAEGGACTGYHPVVTNTACAVDIWSPFSVAGAGYGGGLYSAEGGTLTNVTFENNIAKGGLAYFQGGQASGGGMESNGNITLNLVYFNNNIAAGGSGSISNNLYSMGGIATGGGFTNNGNAFATHTGFTGNTVTGGNGSYGGSASGGGMHNKASCTVTFTTFSGNTATGGFGQGKETGPYNNNITVYCGTGGIGGPASGGGLSTPGQANVANSFFFNNQTRGGAGSFTVLSDIKTTINGGNGSGGGINADGGSTFSNLVLYNNAVIGGTGSGGYYASTGGANGEGQGGGFMGAGNTLTNISVGYNKGNFGGGMAGASVVRNSIFWGNTFNDNANQNHPNNPAYYQIAAAIPGNIHYSIVQGGVNAATDAANHILNSNPLFLSSSDLRLNTGSPAINAGNSKYFSEDSLPNISNITTDLAAKARIAGTAVDMGAYESQADYTGPLAYISAISKDTLCTGAAFTVNYDINGTFNSANSFKIQLSDNAGFFNTPVQLGAKTAATAGKINCTIPASVPTGDYRVRLVATKPVVNAVYDTIIHIDQTAMPSVTIAAPLSICKGAAVMVDAMAVNAGLHPAYQWKRNGKPVGGNSSSYAASDFADGDSISCTITANIACGANTPVNSNALKFKVNELPVVPAIEGDSTYCTLNVSSLTLTNALQGGMWHSEPAASQSTFPGGVIAYWLDKNTNFTYTYTDTNGCTASVSKYVTVSSTMPVAEPITGTAPACGGTVFQLQDASAGGVWTTDAPAIATVSPNGLVTALNGGTFTLSYMVTAPGGGCSAYAYKTITLKQQPAIAPITGGNMLYVGKSLQLANLTPGGVWKMANTTVAGINVAGLVNGKTAGTDVASYSISGTNGCAAVATQALTIKAVPVISPVTGSTSVCTGAPVPFSDATAGGVWSVSNTSVAGIDASGVLTGLKAGVDTVIYTVTNEDGYVSTAKLKIAVVASLTPSVSITTNVASPVCAGVKVTFTATAVNGGTPVYQWYKNNVAVGSNNKSYDDALLKNNDSVWCVITSTAGCLTTNTAKSNVRIFAVNPKLAPTLSVAASTPVTICNGTSVTFTATATNTGNNPKYQWKRNGKAVGSNSNTYTIATLQTGDTIYCVLTISAPCATPATLTSQKLIFTVNPILTPVASVTASVASPICAGVKVTFTAAATNAASPSFQWYKNNLVVGTNNKTYQDATLANGDSIWCVVTTATKCLTANAIKSNVLKYAVNPKLAPALTVTASTGTNICAGTGVTFTANAVNTGANAVLQWKKNNKNVGTNSATYFDNALVTGDSVVCVLTVTAPCATPASITSTRIKFIVNPLLTPAVTISTNAASPICAGVKPTFTAVVTNIANPVYQWYKNKKVVGINSKTYQDTLLKNKDSLWCIVTAPAGCLTANTAKSNVMKYVVNPKLSPTISIAASTSASICQGTKVTFTATVAGAGSGFQYQWKKNGVVVGKNAATYADALLNNNDTVYCILTVTAPCASATTLTSNKIKFTVTTAIPAVPTVIKGTSPVTAGQAGLTYAVTKVDGVQFNWTVPDGVTIVSGQGTYRITVNWGNAPGTISVTASNSCGASPASQKTVAVAGGLVGYNPKDPSTWNAYVKMYPNPATNVVTVEFNAATEDKYEAQLVTSLGQVLQSKALVSMKGINTVSFDITRYASAMYYIRLLDKEHGIRTLKLVKAK